MKSSARLTADKVMYPLQVDEAVTSIVIISYRFQ